MLRIEVDMFSGRPNPVWIVTDSEVTTELLGAVAGTKGAVARQGAGFTGLGFREVRVDLIGDDEPRQKGVSARFSLASTAAADLESSGALARRFIETMPRRSEVQLVQHALTPLSSKLSDLILERLARHLADPPRRFKPRPIPRNPLRTTIDDAACEKCQYEVSQFNPGFWNDPAVQPTTTVTTTVETGGPIRSRSRAVHTAPKPTPWPAPT